MMITGIYSILHCLVDGICALAMFSYFTGETGAYQNFLIYNFCAFALQMPFGTLLDYLNIGPANNRGKRNFACLFAGLGLLLTIAGALTHPAVLGIGNALFHIGGGVDVICEDNRRKWHGKALGVFVAPGALGLYLGTLMAKNVSGSWKLIALAGTSILMGGLFIRLSNYQKKRSDGPKVITNIRSHMNLDGTVLPLLIGCFLVVVLRSYVGLAVTFSWKTTVLASLVSVLAVVLGKMAGGILSAAFGIKRVVWISLVLAAGMYVFSDHMIWGILALFFFNMTMPITLYLLIERFPALPGFSFGLLTFALFLGFAPVYFDMKPLCSGQMLGLAGSLLSLLILAGVLYAKKEASAYDK